MLQPLRDTMLIEVDKADEKTASGLYIKENWATLPPYGTVLAVGPDVTSVKVKDRVLFNRYAALQLEGDERLITEGDVQAIVLPEKKAKNAKSTTK